MVSFKSIFTGFLALCLYYCFWAIFKTQIDTLLATSLDGFFAPVTYFLAMILPFVLFIAILFRSVKEDYTFQ